MIDKLTDEMRYQIIYSLITMLNKSDQCEYEFRRPTRETFPKDGYRQFEHTGEMIITMSLHDKLPPEPLPEPEPKTEVWIGYCESWEVARYLASCCINRFRKGTKMVCMDYDISPCPDGKRHTLRLRFKQCLTTIVDVNGNVKSFYEEMQEPLPDFMRQLCNPE